jgi:amino acid permease
MHSGGSSILQQTTSWCTLLFAGSLTELCATTYLLLQAALTYFTLAVLVRGSAQTGATTYSQLVRVTCGRLPMKVLQLSVLSFCFGFSVVYLVSIGYSQKQQKRFLSLSMPYAP